MDTASAQQTALIVEDDRSLARAINKKLQLRGFSTLQARSVDEAIQQMDQQGDVGVIWLDHYLAGNKDGLDFVTAVKAHNAWKGIPIYIVSNTASGDKVQSYKELGITKYYVKAEHRLDEIINDIQSNTVPGNP